MKIIFLLKKYLIETCSNKMSTHFLKYKHAAALNIVSVTDVRQAR